MDKQVLRTLEDLELTDVRGGDMGPGGFLDPSSLGIFRNENENTNTATAMSSLIGPIFL